MPNEIEVIQCVPCGKKMRIPLFSEPDEATFLEWYKMPICNSCFSGNHDGFAGQSARRVTNHLTRHGIPLPNKNSNGWIPMRPS